MSIYFPRLLREHTCIHAYTAKSKRQGGWVHDTLTIIFTTSLPTHPSAYPQRALPYLYLPCSQKMPSTYVTCRIHMQATRNLQHAACSMQEPMQGPRSKSSASAAERAQLLLSVSARVWRGADEQMTLGREREQMAVWNPCMFIVFG
jgi:hypothetical protein